ncbi:hypothetical protein KSC_020770 [Ktedonobacter sp. SOSP1-52]|nr:hypothetical protein [Ktedonobacter sp. SOSP1-52]GHO63185.1 hypothetical protein KSC_020770 [Ktedonobacter sp. SOSP1-52]
MFEPRAYYRRRLAALYEKKPGELFPALMAGKMIDLPPEEQQPEGRGSIEIIFDESVAFVIGARRIWPRRLGLRAEVSVVGSRGMSCRISTTFGSFVGCLGCAGETCFPA